METNRETNETEALRFGVGAVLGRTFSTLFRGFGVFLSLSFIAALVVGVIGYLLSGIVRWRFLKWTIGLSVGLLIQGAVAFGVFQILTGGAASLGDSLSHGRKRIFSLAGTSLLASLCPFMLIPLVHVISGLNVFYSDGSRALLETRGGEALLWIIAAALGLLVMELLCMWSVALPTCAVERLGPMESVKRSARLTSGHHLKIYGLALLAFIIIRILGWIISFVTAGLFRSAVFVALGAAVVRIFSQAFANVMIAVAYYDLRAAKEGVSIESLPNAFD
ncbi:MAG: hypothetical protein LBQ42_03270 [Synergistaceae bacterium]|jgi:hypothetical protein|nr:hypothetical protein [Synergistaceae bacterium]